VGRGWGSSDGVQEGAALEWARVTEGKEGARNAPWEVAGRLALDAVARFRCSYFLQGRN
jgi:hypothetical protein